MPNGANPNPTSDPTLFADVSAIYTTYQNNFAQIYAACTTDQQRSMALNQYSSARDTYWAAVGKVLADLNPTVQSVDADLKTANATVAKCLQNLKDITAFINAAAEALQLAASLVTLAAAA
jgi:hypothetical protein